MKIIKISNKPSPKEEKGEGDQVVNMRNGRFIRLQAAYRREKESSLTEQTSKRKRTNVKTHSEYSHTLSQHSYNHTFTQLSLTHNHIHSHTHTYTYTHRKQVCLCVTDIGQELKTWNRKLLLQMAALETSSSSQE